MEMFGTVTRATTIGEILDMMEASGAGIFQYALVGADDKTQYAIIIVNGADASREIMSAVSKITKGW